MRKSVVIAALLILAGCGESKVDQLETENEELRSLVADLESQLSSMRSAA